MDDRGKTAQENITPHFYNMHGDGKNVLNEAEKRAIDSDGAPQTFNGPSNSSVKASKTGFISSVGSKAADAGKKKGLIKKITKVGALFAILAVFLVAIIIVALTPQFLIGNIDYNLQSVLGFGDTVAVLEKQAEYVTATALKEGKVRDDYAVDLESSGLLVGQIAANGEFVRTNTYIADLGVPKELASTGAVYGNEALDISLGKQEDGQLVMKYNNEVINGDNFVAKVESDPKMYYAYSTALDIASRYYYSDEVTKYYNENGFSRNSFAGWTPSGNKETDDKNFEEMLERALDVGDAVGTDGLDMEWYLKCGRSQGNKEDCRDTIKLISAPENQLQAAIDEAIEECKSSGEYDECISEDRKIIGIFENKSLEEGVSEFDDADALTAAVSEGTMIERDAKLSKEKAVSILATAMSSMEPYTQAKAFLAVEESINRARAGNEGPVNQVMDSMAKRTLIKATDPKTGETVEKNESMFNTHNFAIAASDGGQFSKEEAALYSRDNIINTMNNVGGTNIDKDRINNTAVSTSESRQANTLMTMNHEGELAGDLEALNNTLDNTFFNSPAKTFSSSLGGNRVVAGGSYLSNAINQYAIGALSSDTGQMEAHHDVVEEVIARKAEAERSTLSPFDISSKNTLFGKIAHDFASVMIRNYGNNNGISMASVASAAAGLTNYSVSTIMNGAYAAAEESYTMLNGDCPTPNSAANTNGTLACNSHETPYTGFMAYTMEDYRNSVIGDSLDEEGKIKDDSLAAEIIALGVGRGSIVGNANSDVCERYKAMKSNGIQKAIKSFRDFVGVNNYLDQYERCGNTEEVEGENGEKTLVELALSAVDSLVNGPEVPIEVATGAKYTLSESNPDNETMKVFSAYSMYQMVRSMLTDNENEVTAFKERYYAKYPKDNSAAGIIARRSGMTKREAQIALNYADYLNAIARYDASTRMAFGKINLNIEVEDVPLVIKENQEFNNELALIVANKNGQIVRREDKTTV